MSRPIIARLHISVLRAMWLGHPDYDAVAGVLAGTEELESRLSSPAYRKRAMSMPISSGGSVALLGARGAGLAARQALPTIGWQSEAR